MKRLASSWLAVRRRRGQKGQTLIIMAFLSIFMISLLGLVIDSVRLYVLSAQAERAAEAAALAAALYMPNYFSESVPPFSPDGESAQKRACDVLQQNGITSCLVSAGQIGGQVSTVPTNPYEVQVTVTLQANIFFLALVSPNLATANVTRSALAEFLPTIELGSRSSSFGDEADNPQSFWASINGPSDLKEQGDAYTPKLEEGPTDPKNYPDSTNQTAYAFNRFPAYGNATNHDQYGQPECVGCPSGPISNPDVQPTGLAGYNYQIVVPANAGNVQVEIYNPAFIYANPADSTGDRIDIDASKDPTFNGKTDQQNEYMQMTYSLYSVPLLFERSTDKLVTSSPSQPMPFQPASLDITDKSAHGCSQAWDPQAQQCVTTLPSYVDSWYTLYTIPNSSTQATYRLSVQATGYYGSKNYGLKLTATNPVSGLSIFAWNDMCVYFNNISVSGSTFDLGEIPAAYAGKTLHFKLFDPGDSGNNGNVDMSILDPTGKAVQLAPPADTWIRTTSNGTDLEASINDDRIYNGLWLDLPIVIPPTYNPTPGQDWWQIEYKATNTAPTDKLTISISLSGSPVHLVNEVP